MIYSKDFSVIIPQRNAVSTLPRLLASIPQSEKIEIIIVDNTPTPISKSDIHFDGEYTLLWSSPDRHAGGARNVGIDNAHGKWLVFADADDFFTDEAFDMFYDNYDSDAEIVHFGMSGIYEESGKEANRGKKYRDLIKAYLQGNCEEIDIRLQFVTPCCKMVSHDLIQRHNLHYDEIRAGNDKYFSITSGYYARKIKVVDRVCYVATVSKGSLTRSWNYDIIKSRLYSMLHCNQFLKQHGLSSHQGSIMYILFEAKKMNIKQQIELLKMVVRFRQNPFVGFSHWKKSIIERNKREKEEKGLVVRN